MPVSFNVKGIRSSITGFVKEHLGIILFSIYMNKQIPGLEWNLIILKSWLLLTFLFYSWRWCWEWLYWIVYCHTLWSVTVIFVFAEWTLCCNGDGVFSWWKYPDSASDSCSHIRFSCRWQITLPKTGRVCPFPLWASWTGTFPGIYVLLCHG